MCRVKKALIRLSEKQSKMEVGRSAGGRAEKGAEAEDKFRQKT